MKKHIANNQKGIVHHLLLIVLAVVVLGGAGFAGWRVWQGRDEAGASSRNWPADSSAVLGSPALLIDTPGKTDPRYTVTALYNLNNGKISSAESSNTSDTTNFPALVSYSQIDVKTGRNIFMHEQKFKFYDPLSNVVNILPGSDEINGEMRGQQFPLYCVSNGHLVAVTNFSKKNEKIFVLNMKTRNSYSYDTKEYGSGTGQTYHQLSCTDSKVYFSVRNVPIVNENYYAMKSINFTSKTKKPVNEVSTSKSKLELNNISSCGNQFHRDNLLVYTTSNQYYENDKEGWAKIVLYNPENDSVRYESYKKVIGDNKKTIYPHTCQIAPDSKQLIFGGSDKLSEGMKYYQYSISSGEFTKLPRGIQNIKGWTGTKLNY